MFYITTISIQIFVSSLAVDYPSSGHRTPPMGPNQFDLFGLYLYYFFNISKITLKYTFLDSINILYLI